MANLKSAFQCLVFALSMSASEFALAQDTPEIGRPTTIPGTIAAPPSSDPAAPPVSEHSVRLAAGSRIRARVDSSQIDPVLEVAEQANGEVIAADDDSGGNLNAMTTFPVRRDGLYSFRVRSFDARVGTYTLSIERLPALPEAAAIPDATVRMIFNMADGALAADDPRGRAHFDDYRLSMGAGEEVIVRLQSFDFDPSVSILRASDRDGAEIAFENELKAGPGALLLFRATTEDDYVIRVSSNGDEQTGRYRLWVGRVR